MECGGNAKNGAGLESIFHLYTCTLRRSPMWVRQLLEKQGSTESDLTFPSLFLTVFLQSAHTLQGAPSNRANGKVCVHGMGLEVQEDVQPTNISLYSKED